MHDTQQSNDERHLLLNMILIVLETVFSFILKNDSITRIQAKKFIRNQITLKVSGYIPLFEIYVQFTEKGLLFDRIKPQQNIDLNIHMSLTDIFKIFFLSNQPNIELIRIEGNADLAADFKALLLHFTLPSLLSDWRQWIVPSAHTHPEDGIGSSKRIAPFIAKIEQQRNEISQLKMELVQYKYRLDQAQVRQRNILIFLGCCSFILLICLLYTVFLS